MSEYIEYPVDHFLPDESFGREFDPYPDGRRASRQNLSVATATANRPSWISSNVPPQSARPLSTPLTPINMVSPVPTVQRLGPGDYDGPRGPRTPARSIQNLSPSAMAPPNAQFRHLDVPEPTRWTQATMVSYPTQSSVRGPMRGDTGSTFVPRGASTPTPYRYTESDRYHQPSRYQPRAYGEPADSDNGSEPDPEPFGDEEEHVENAEEEEEEEDEHYDEYEYNQDNHHSRDQTVEDMTVPGGDFEMVGNEAYAEPEKKVRGRKFVGGFMMGLKNFMGGGKPRHDFQTGPDAGRPIPHGPQPVRPFMAGPNGTPLVYQTPTIPLVNGPSHSPQGSQRMADQSGSTGTTSDARSSNATTTGTESSVMTPDMTVELPNPHESQLIHSPPAINSPIAIPLQPTDDYDAMSEPYSSEADAETSFSSRLNTVGRFFSELTTMPWINSHVSVDYRPGDSRRARDPGEKPKVSWYSKENHEKLDLLATPNPNPITTRPRVRERRREPTRDRTKHHHSHSHHGHDRRLEEQRRRRPRTPPESPSSMNVTRPTGAVGRGSSQGQGPHTLSYGYYYAATPQPLYVYPSPVASPQGRSGTDMLPTIRFPSPTGGDRQLPSAVPVVMLAPAPVVMPGSPDKHAKGSTQRAKSPNTPHPLGSQPHSRSQSHQRQSRSQTPKVTTPTGSTVSPRERARSPPMIE